MKIKDLLSFKRGVHPPEHKALTAGLPSRRLPFPSEVLLPLVQYGGIIATPRVKVGDRVIRGDLLADAEGPLAVPLHASVSGSIKSIEPWVHPNGSTQPTLRIRVDPHACQRPRERLVPDWHSLDSDGIIKAVRDAGLVGMGGASFPTALKLRPPKEHQVKTLLLNGCECEPYLTSDHRVMVEHPQRVLMGIRILFKALDIERAVIGIEVNKPDAIAALRRWLPNDLDIRVQPLRVKYPQGAEKMLIQVVTGQELPPGMIPSAVGTVVHNVTTVAQIAEVFETGQPLLERMVTVSGHGIRKPGNWIVPTGTPLKELLKACGGMTESARQLVFGGPMMGHSQASLEVPLLKATGGVLVLDQTECQEQQQMPCIHCGRCVQACPMGLNPQRLGSLARKERFDEMEQAHLNDCLLCGSCAFTCPSNIPLSQLFGASKTHLRKVKSL